MRQLKTEIKFGVQCPPSDYDGIVEIAKHADQAMFDFLTLPDELIYPNSTPLEPWTLLSSLCMLTRNVRLGVMVSDVYRHHPVILAHMVSTVDIISRGRIVLGLGAGSKENLDPLGIEFTRIIPRMREYIGVLRSLWGSSEESVDWDGTSFKLKGARTAKPYKSRRVPIWIAGNSNGTLKLAAELGDGWIPVGVNASEYCIALKSLEDHANSLGRTLEPFDRCIFLFLAPSDGDSQVEEWVSKFFISMFPDLCCKIGLEQALNKLCLRGTPDNCVRTIEEYVKCGARIFILRPMGNGKQALSIIDQFANTSPFLRHA